MFLIPVLFIFLNLLGLLIIARNRNRSDKKPWFLAGLVFGLSAIARPNVLIIIPMLALWLFFHFRKKLSTRSLVVVLLVFLIGSAIPVLPITVRNYIVADDLVLISSQGGVNLYLGNNSAAEGLTMMMPEITLDARIPWNEFVPTMRKYAEEQTGHALKPSDVSAFWSNKAKQFIFENPGKFISLTFKKLVYFFSGFENSDQTDIYSFRKYSSLISILIFDNGLKFPFGLIAPLGLIGIALSWRKRKQIAPLLIFFFGYIPTVIMFLVTARHRLTIIPIFLLFAAVALVYIYDKFKSGQLKNLIITLPVLALLIVLLNTNHFDLGFQNISQVHYNLALTHSRNGELDDAIREFKLAIDEAPDVAVLYFGLGTAYNEIGQYREAEMNLSRATALDPQYVEAHINLGIARMELGQLDRAASSFRLAISIDTTFVEPFIHLGDISLEKNEAEAARRYYLKSMAMNPENHVVQTKLGMIYGRAGDTAAANEYFRGSLELNPAYSPAYLNWGNICLINGDTSLALQKYDSAISCNPNALEPYYNLAVLHIRMGDLSKAREYVDSLLVIDPEFQPGLALLKRLGN